MHFFQHADLMVVIGGGKIAHFGTLDALDFEVSDFCFIVLILHDNTEFNSEIKLPNSIGMTKNLTWGQGGINEMVQVVVAHRHCNETRLSRFVVAVYIYVRIHTYRKLLLGFELLQLRVFYNFLYDRLWSMFGK